MDNTRIRLYSLDQLTTIDKVEAKRKAPKWALRIIQPIHKWLGDFITHPLEKSVTYHTTEIKIDKYLDVIKRHARNIENTTMMRPKYLLIGREDYYNMTGEVMKGYPFSVGPYPETQLQIFGLQIIIVPWIDGMFCLPDLDEMRR